MIWPFNRKAKPGPTFIRAKDQWCIGDLARCVCDDWIYGGASCPKVGDVLRVSRVASNGVACDGRFVSETMLGFEGKPPTSFWCSTGFVKIQPKHEACDTEFAAMIKRSRRVPIEEE